MWTELTLLITSQVIDIHHALSVIEDLYELSVNLRITGLNDIR
jgi:hypothetical protein